MSASALVRSAGGGTVKLPVVLGEDVGSDAFKTMALIWLITGAAIVGFVLLMTTVLLVADEVDD